MQSKIVPSNQASVATPFARDNLSVFPNEILNEILYSAFSPHKREWPTLLEKRYKLSCISRRCTRIVQENTCYWNIITVNRSSSTETIDLWLARSQQCQLTLRVHAENWYHPYIPMTSMFNFHTILLPTIQQALGRVRSLHVGASNHADAVSTLDVLARLGIRKLTQLKLHNWVNNTDSAEQVSIPAMHNLATVVLEGIDPRRLGASMWATITTLKLSRTPPPSTPPHAIHVLDVLAAATSLTVLHLDNLAVAPWDKRTRVRMPAVEDFWLGCVDNASLILAAPLDLPRLDRLRVDFMGNVTLGQLLNVCGSLFHKASTIELYLSDTSDAEIAQLYGLLRTTRILDFRDCLPRLGIGILYHILTKQTTLPHLRLLRLPTNTKADVLADVLINAAAKHFGPEFTLTTGRGRTNNFEVNVSRKMDKRWFLKGNDLQHDDFTEDREKIRFGKWVNVTIDEYIETYIETVC